MKTFVMPARPEDNLRVATEGGRYFAAGGEYVDLSEFYWHQRLQAGDIRQGTEDEEEDHLLAQSDREYASASAERAKADAERLADETAAKAAAEKADAERLAQANEEKAEAERLAREESAKAEADKADAERVAMEEAEKAEASRQQDLLQANKKK
jgi:hypothetical protein